MSNGGASMVSVSVVVVLFVGVDGSYAIPGTVPVSTALAVPDTTPPLASNVMPDGSEALTSDHAHGLRPPVQLKACVYRDWNIASGKVDEVMRTGFVPGGRRSSPDTAVAAWLITPSTSAPRFRPSVPTPT